MHQVAAFWGKKNPAATAGESAENGERMNRIAEQRRVMNPTAGNGGGGVGRKRRIMIGLRNRLQGTERP